MNGLIRSLIRDLDRIVDELCEIQTALDDHVRADAAYDLINSARVDVTNARYLLCP